MLDQRSIKLSGRKVSYEQESMQAKWSDTIGRPPIFRSRKPELMVMLDSTGVFTVVAIHAQSLWARGKACCRVGCRVCWVVAELGQDRGWTGGLPRLKRTENAHLCRHGSRRARERGSLGEGVQGRGMNMSLYGTNTVHLLG
jgi:hypothetical protein